MKRMATTFNEANTVEALARDLLCGGVTHHTAVGARLDRRLRHRTPPRHSCRRAFPRPRSYSGTEIRVLDHEHLVIRENDVLAVLQ